MLWVVPRDEFPAVFEIQCRRTTFRHTGDFGVIGDWTADITATVDEPLLVTELEPGASDRPAQARFGAA